MMERAQLIGRLQAMRYLIAIGGEIVSRQAQCDSIEALDEAVELLRAQAPRLLNADDFKRDDADDDGGGIPCWKETKSPNRRNGWAVIVYGKWLADKDIARYWTGKPTKAKMAATPWPNDNDNRLED